MKTYSDLPDTKLHIQLSLEVVGNPECRVGIDDDIIDYRLSQAIILDYYRDLTDIFSINIELINKEYTEEYETAIILGLSVDGINIVPEYTHLAHYDNDHGFKDPTNYLGFNGKWTLTFDRPFYQWLHQAQNQGWLIG